MTVPESVKALRTRAGLSKRELAEKLGVKLVTVHCWETEGLSGGPPKAGHLQQLLDLVGASDKEAAEAFRALANDQRRSSRTRATAA